MHGLEPSLIPLSQRFDLANYLRRRYGPLFVPHPQLWHALQINGFGGAGLLDKEGSPARPGRRGDYAALLTNLALRVSGVVDLFECVRSESLKLDLNVAIAQSKPCALDPDGKGILGLAGADLQAVMRFAETELKGKECRVLELVCAGRGCCRLADLACDAQVEWDAPYDDAFNSTRKPHQLQIAEAGLDAQTP